MANLSYRDNTMFQTSGLPINRKLNANNCPVPHKFFRNRAIPAHPPVWCCAEKCR